MKPYTQYVLLFTSLSMLSFSTFSNQNAKNFQGALQANCDGQLYTQGSTCKFTNNNGNDITVTKGTGQQVHVQDDEGDHNYTLSKDKNVVTKTNNNTGQSHKYKL